MITQGGGRVVAKNKGRKQRLKVLQTLHNGGNYTPYILKYVRDK